MFHHFGYKATLLKRRLSGQLRGPSVSPGWCFMAKYSAVLGDMESIGGPAPKAG